MSGVIDANGVQWEHCNNCGGWVNIDELMYEKPSEQFELGRDLCPKCAKGNPNVRKGMTVTVHFEPRKD